MSLTESLHGTSWDVVLAGTGIQQSLLALALSRSGKRVLHLDRNHVYGGSEAALNLQDCDRWVATVNNATAWHPFGRAATTNPADPTSLGNPRSYSLALAPNILYTRSALLPILVSSRAQTQLEFKAVGSWYLCQRRTEPSTAHHTALVKVPDSREDIFADQSLTVKTKGALVRFLRYVSTLDEKTDDWTPVRDQPFPDFLAARFKIPPHVQDPLLALTLIDLPRHSIKTGVALTRIANHLASIGLFGGNFSAVVPQWGGMSEITQVSCRAAAVGGATYVLACSIRDISRHGHHDGSAVTDDIHDWSLELGNGDVIQARHVVGTPDELPSSISLLEPLANTSQSRCTSRSISIVSSPLASLFQSTVDSPHRPAAVVVILPSASEVLDESDGLDLPIHIVIHSSDTGECPNGQCVIYASVAVANASSVLSRAVSTVLEGVCETPTPLTLWSIHYEQHTFTTGVPVPKLESHPNIHVFGSPGLDTCFDEKIIESVKQTWQTITGDDACDFMIFPERDTEASADDSVT